MRRLLLLTGVAILSAAGPALANEEQQCFQGKEPTLRIKDCSKLIERDPTDAPAFHNRAVAFGMAGDLDSAIADYSKVIDIAPFNASAYANRSRAYASKGERTHALADAKKASTLIAVATAHTRASTFKKPQKTTKTKVAKVATIPRTARRTAMITSKPDDNNWKEPTGAWWLWPWGIGAARR